MVPQPPDQALQSPMYIAAGLGYVLAIASDTMFGDCFIRKYLEI